MLNLLNANYPLKVNGVLYPSSQAAFEAMADFDGDVEVFIGPAIDSPNLLNQGTQQQPEKNKFDDTLYKVKVRQYMTKPSSPGFDFMQKWNNNTPMPFRTMVGHKLEETKGMIKMKLWGKPFPTNVCLVCGRTLTNKVSVLYGIGPECGGHGNVPQYETEAEVKANYEAIRQSLENITWEGWIIKTAIIDIEDITE